jgi:BolA protein
LTARSDRIAERLRERLAAVHVEVVDESHLHAGHAGAASGGGHFRATIVSPRFAGLSRLAAQRLVYEALGDLMQHEIHALTLTLRSERGKSGDGLK